MSKIIIASGPVIVENNKVLLNKHGDTEFYKFCGGSINDNDNNLIKAAERKAMEEMGIKIKVVNTEPFITFTRKEIDNNIVDVILVHFLSEIKSSINPRSDIRKWDWINLDELNKENLGPNIIPTLKYFKFLK